MKRIINGKWYDTDTATLVDLRWADLTEADLTWADLTGADLTGADLTGANMTWVIGYNQQTEE